jgi:hypothetical protein
MALRATRRSSSASWSVIIFPAFIAALAMTLDPPAPSGLDSAYQPRGTVKLPNPGVIRQGLAQFFAVKVTNRKHIVW